MNQPAEPGGQGLPGKPGNHADEQIHFSAVDEFLAWGK